MEARRQIDPGMDAEIEADERDDQIQQMGNVLRVLVTAMVDAPEKVAISILPGRQSMTFEVSVAQPDVPRIIGRNGRTANAIREILTNLAGKYRLGTPHLEILEPKGRTPARS